MAILGNPPINHVYREANIAADVLTKNTDTLRNELVVFEQPPNGVVVELLYDIAGCTLNRVVA